MRHLVYYVATSLDGFIADPDGGVEAFTPDRATIDALFARYPETCPTHLRGPLGVSAAPARFDAVIMGASTHQPALDGGLTSAYPHLQQYVVTHRELPAGDGVRRLHGDLASQIAALKRESGRDIWLCGGGQVAAQLLDLIDEFQVKVNPVLFGAGTPMIAGDYQPLPLALSGAETLPGGVALATYRRAEQ